MLSVGGKVGLSKKEVSGPTAGAKWILPLSLSQKVNKSFVRVRNDRARGCWLECIHRRAQSLIGDRRDSSETHCLVEGQWNKSTRRVKTAVSEQQFSFLNWFYLCQQRVETERQNILSG